MADGSRFYLVRHARPTIRAPQTFLGATDLPLCEEGRAQAKALAPFIASLALDRCVCSPLARARQTAEIIAPHMTREIVPELREITFGRWDGHTFAEVRESDPELLERWIAFDPAFEFPGGDRMGDFFDRAARAADRLAAEAKGSTLVVAHGGLIRGLLCRWLNLDRRNYIAFNIAYASLVAVDVFENGLGTLAIEPPVILPEGVDG